MRILIIALLIAVTGCQHDPFTSVYTTTQPKTNDLAGVYTADTDTMAVITNEGHYSPAGRGRIILRLLETTNDRVGSRGQHRT